MTVIGTETALHPQAHVTIVVLNWNGWQDTLACLDSLALQDYENRSIIVVDNASTDDSRSHILEWFRSTEYSQTGRTFLVDDPERGDEQPIALQSRDCVYIQSSVNSGFASGNNLGIRYAMKRDVQFLWILNNDTVAAPTALSALIARAQQDEGIGMCGSLLIDFHDRNQVQTCGGVNFDYQLAVGQPLGQGLPPDEAKLRVWDPSLTYVSGASLLVRAEMIDKVGTFDERYFLYFEEIDWATRANDWRMAVALNSVVYHKESASIGNTTTRRSPLGQYYINRNLILFYARFHKGKLHRAVAHTLRELIWQIQRKDWQLMRMTWRAIVDGLLARTGKADPLIFQ